MAPEDIESSLAHAEMLAETGIINLPDANAGKQGLEEILAELEAGDLEFSTARHMNIESRLKDKIANLLADSTLQDPAMTRVKPIFDFGSEAK